jgi:Flp pilus assembly protein TadD
MTAPTVDPVEHAAGVSRGTDLLRAARYTDALAQFNTMRPFATRHPDTLSGLAIAADMTGNTRQAERAYMELARVADDRAAFYNNRGYSRMLRGELQAAYTDLTRAASLSPDNAKIAGNLRMLRAVLPRREAF